MKTEKGILQRDQGIARQGLDSELALRGLSRAFGLALAARFLSDRLLDLTRLIDTNPLGRHQLLRETRVFADDLQQARAGLILTEATICALTIQLQTFIGERPAARTGRNLGLKLESLFYDLDLLKELTEDCRTRLDEIEAAFDHVTDVSGSFVANN